MPRPNGRDPETDPAAYLGKQLRRARMAAGCASQDALATALGFERSTITKAESGARAPTEDVFDKWCEICRITPEVREVLAGLNVVLRNADGPIPAWRRRSDGRATRPALAQGELQRQRRRQLRRGRERPRRRPGS